MLNTQTQPTIGTSIDDNPFLGISVHFPICSEGEYKSTNELGVPDYYYAYVLGAEGLDSDDSNSNGSIIGRCDSMAFMRQEEGAFRHDDDAIVLSPTAPSFAPTARLNDEAQTGVSDGGEMTPRDTPNPLLGDGGLAAADSVPSFASEKEKEAHWLCQEIITLGTDFLTQLKTEADHLSVTDRERAVRLVETAIHRFESLIAGEGVPTESSWVTLLMRVKLISNSETRKQVDGLISHYPLFLDIGRS